MDPASACKKLNFASHWPVFDEWTWLKRCFGPTVWVWLHRAEELSDDFPSHRDIDENDPAKSFVSYAESTQAA